MSGHVRLPEKYLCWSVSLFRKLYSFINRFVCSHSQDQTACDILSMCLDCLDLKDSDSASPSGVLIEDMVRHENDALKVIGLQQLLKNSPDQVISTAAIVDVIKCLGNATNTTVGTLAMRLLDVQLETRFDQEEVRSALEATRSNSISKCRFYEVIVRMASRDAQNLQRTGEIISEMVRDLASDDLLLQLNVMEILSQLVATEHGLEYLEAQGVFPRLTAALENIDSMHILFPGFIKFVGSLANAHTDKMFPRYVHICKPLFEVIISNDSSTLSPCLDTLGVIGRTQAGKVFLDDLTLVNPDGDMKMIFMELAMFLTQLPTEEQIRILHCLENLFQWLSTEDGGEQEPNNRISMITEKWYKYLDRGPGLKTVMAYCRNPFPDIKLAGFGVLRAIVDFSWGRTALSETAGGLEYIMDRSMEFHKESFQAKFQVLKCIQRAGSETCFTEDQRKDIDEYVHKGPFYIKGETEIATERRH